MRVKSTVIGAILVLSCVSGFAQSIEETERYITSELPQLFEPGSEFLGFDNHKGTHITFMVRQNGGIDSKTRIWYYELESIDVYVVATRRGFALQATTREGAAKPIDYRCSDGTKLLMKSTFIVAETMNETKLRKVERAFNHLITLATGRKELF